MGKFDGKQIIGLIGGLVFKKGRNGKQTIVQKAPAKVTQTRNSKKTSGIMGNASTLAKEIRIDYTTLTDSFYQGNMVNRLNTVNRSILEHCFDKATEKYAFEQDSFNNLAGFEFNEKSLLSNYFWVQPVFTTNGNTLTLTIPAFSIPQQLKMPAGANTCEIYIKMGQYALFERHKERTKLHILDIPQGETQVPEKEFIFNMENGCLCIVGIAIKYYNAFKQIKTPLNDKELNPAAISYAFFNPGEFVLPPTGSTRTKGIASMWSFMDKFNFTTGEK